MYLKVYFANGVVLSTWLWHGTGHADGSNFKDICHGKFVQSLCLFPHLYFWTPRIMRISCISFNHQVMFKPWELVESQLQTFWHIFGIYLAVSVNNSSVEPRNGRRKHRRHPQSYWRLDQHWQRVRCRSHVQWRFWSRASTEAWQTWRPFNMQGLLSPDSLDPNLCELEVMGDADGEAWRSRIIAHVMSRMNLPPVLWLVGQKSWTLKSYCRSLMESSL